jgi:hypothetical protein
MFTEQDRALTFWGPDLCQVLEAPKFWTSKVIFIIDTGDHIKIKNEADINESNTTNSIYIQRWQRKVKMKSACAIHKFKYLNVQVLPLLR